MKKWYLWSYKDEDAHLGEVTDGAPELPRANEVVTASTPIVDFWHYGSVG
ncbi:MAG: hypothetical protein ACRDU4_07985 [Mycobacterium sp.]